MVSSVEGSRDTLHYCLEGTKADLITWGTEYLRALGGEIGQEYQKLNEKEEDVTPDISHLDFLINLVVPYNMQHNAEPEAVDLLMEIEQLPNIVQYCNEANYERVCLYLLSCSFYASDPDEMKKAFRAAFDIYI